MNEEYSVKTFAVTVLIVVFILILTFGILNFFNILSLSLLYPKLFGWLPHQPFSTSIIPKQSLSLSQAENNIFPCPLKLSPCPDSSEITSSTKTPNFRGLGFNDIQPGTDVTAVFPGTLEVVQMSGDVGSQDITIYLTKQYESLRAQYIFKGSLLEDKIESGMVVSQGEPIGILGEGGRGRKQFGQKYNLIISFEGQPGQFLKFTLE